MRLWMSDDMMTNEVEGMESWPIAGTSPPLRVKLKQVPSSSIYLSIYLYIYQSTYLYIYLSIYTSIYLCIYISIHLFINVCIHLSMYLYIYLSNYSSCSHLEHWASVKRFVSLQFVNLRQSVGLLGLGISPTQGRYQHRKTQTQNTRRQKKTVPWMGFEPTIPVFEGRRLFMP
jgi:hypothetical protein